MIRKAVNADIPQLINLYAGIREIPDYPGQIHDSQYFLDYISLEIRFVLVAELDGKIVGALNGDFDDSEKYSYITNVVVASDFRGHGIGGKLIKEVENMTLLRGYKKVMLYVYEWNLNMQNIVEHYSFKSCDKLVIYTKELTV